MDRVDVTPAMLAITPTREGISDRFPHLSFVVRVPPSRWFEVACATDPRLFWPQYAGCGGVDNFATSRAQGLLRAPAGEAAYLVPRDQLRHFVGARRLFYALGSYLTADNQVQASPWRLTALDTATDRSGVVSATTITKPLPAPF